MWAPTDDKTGYVSEISTLECNHAMICPCGHPIDLKNSALYDREGDVVKWVKTCPRCRKVLHIFND